MLFRSQFVPPPFGFYGNLARNTLRIPGIAAVDFSLSKRTAVTEKLSAQFRAEMFNIFNHANFGSPGASLFQLNAANGAVTRNAASVGRITSTISTSRQIQFGLKLLF